MTNENNKKNYYKILIPILLLNFFPFPSKLIGYSLALYISDFILMGYLIIICIKNNYKISINNSFIILITFCIMNIIGIFNGVLNNGADLRQVTELVRVFEWIIIYIYLYNTIRNTIKNGIEKYFLKSIIISLVILIPFIIIELFELPLKSYLEKFYELGKSGNIFQYYNRIVGTFRNPNMLGMWMTMVVSVILLSNYKNVIKILCLLISLGIIYFTGSRTAIIIAILLTIIIYSVQMFQKGNKRKFLNNIFIIIIVAMIAFNIIKQNSNLFYSIRLSNLQEDVAGLNGRTEIWGQYRENIENNILLGNGIVKSDSIIFDNLYIQYMYYYGVVGIILLSIMFIRNINRTIIIYKKEKDKRFMILMLSIQFIVLIAGITIQVLDVLQMFFYYIFVMAYLDNKIENISNK